jgi:hypothetical protein
MLAHTATSGRYDLRLHRLVMTTVHSNGRHSVVNCMIVAVLNADTTHALHDCSYLESVINIYQRLVWCTVTAVSGQKPAAAAVRSVCRVGATLCCKTVDGVLLLTTMAAGALMLRHVFGLKGDVRNNVHYYDESHVLYPAGQNIVVFNLETRTQFKISAVVDTYALGFCSHCASLYPVTICIC